MLNKSCSKNNHTLGTGPGRFSDSSILRQFDIPKVRYSESWTNNVNLPNIPKIKENFLQ